MNKKSNTYIIGIAVLVVAVVLCLFMGSETKEFLVE